MNDTFFQLPITCVKIGGSLFDLPDLKSRLLNFLHEYEFEHPVLIPGGGRLADEIRRLDKTHHLGEVLSHKLGVSTLKVTAQFVTGLSRRFRLALTAEELQQHWTANQYPVLDTTHLILNEPRLPASWDVTSDSIAGWLTSQHPESKLILLKSTDLGDGISLTEAARQQLVDEHFPLIARDLANLYWCNLRANAPSLTAWVR